MNEHYVDADGVYVGYYDQQYDPTWVVVPSAPTEYGMRWDFTESEWVWPIILISELNFGLWAMFDTAARGRGHQTSDSIVSYLTSSYQPWADDANDMKTWRDSTLALAFDNYQDILDGVSPRVSLATFLSVLPPIVWSNP